MKRCPQCNSENSDSMNFCLQCGAALPKPMVINLQNDPPPTQVYKEGAPTNSGGARPTNSFPNNPQPNFNPNYRQQQPPKRSNTKLFLILGGVFALFLLFVVAGIAIVGYNLMTSPSKTTANNNTTVSTPTPRTITANTSTTPVAFPSSTPLTSSSKDPSATPMEKSATDPNGKIDKTWVDYNVKNGARTGMRIHNKFSVFNMKDTECYLAVYFQKADGTRLTSDITDFRSQNGNLALFKLLKPSYDNTVYEDLDVFMPYGEINVPPGKHKLTMDVDLITKDGNLIQHMNFHNFEYERFAK